MDAVLGVVTRCRLVDSTYSLHLRFLVFLGFFNLLLHIPSTDQSPVVCLPYFNFSRWITVKLYHAFGCLPSVEVA